MQASIEVENLTKMYGDFVAVNNISFTVNAGETFGILGPNGAGKTTTLEMIEGLKRITSGTVARGRDRRSEPDPCGKGDHRRAASGFHVF